MVLLRAIAFAPGAATALSPPASPSRSPAPAPRPAVIGAPDRQPAPAVSSAAVAPVGALAASMQVAPIARTPRGVHAGPTGCAGRTGGRGTAAAGDAFESLLDGTAAADRWTELVQQMVESGRIQAMVRELAWQAGCTAVGREGGVEVWRLRVEREPLRADACRDKLEAALAATLGRPVRIRLEPGAAADSPALRDAALREQRQQEAERTIREDPLVRALLSQYKTARIVPGSIKAH
jgi:DNA polymerase-3 subunit gamma/tau